MRAAERAVAQRDGAAEISRLPDLSAELMLAGMWPSPELGAETVAAASAPAAVSVETMPFVALADGPEASTRSGSIAQAVASSAVPLSGGSSVAVARSDDVDEGGFGVGLPTQPAPDATAFVAGAIHTADADRTPSDDHRPPEEAASQGLPAPAVFADEAKPEFHFADCGCATCCEGGREVFDDAVGAGGEGGPSGTTGSNLPVFTLDQIADQLTRDFWQSIGGAGERSFAVGQGDTLNVDISELRQEGQSLAREALDAWTLVTGINFNEVSALPSPSIYVTEGADAAASTSTAYSMSVGQGFRGGLGPNGDRDAVAVDLVAGRTYTIALSGDDRSGNPLFDPYLRVLNASGSLVAQNDDADGYDSRLSFTAPSTGRYYLQAGAYSDQYEGDYALTIGESQAEVHIRFGDSEAGAYAQSTTIGSTILSSFVNVNWNWTGGGDRIDSYHYQTYLHEIGHALGLGHAGNYNGGATFGVDNHYQNDSWAVSLMSYFHQTENSFTTDSFAYAITPMMADILAIQNLYGAPEAMTGDTTYGENGTTGDYLDDALTYGRATAWTVFDTDGTDHFDFSSYGTDQRIDLRPETWSDAGGLAGNLAIARGTVIENATTGAGNDRLTGNDAENGLNGGSGGDTLDGGAGRDMLVGGDDADSLSGGDGGDLLIGEGITLAELLDLFPTWTPPADAEALIAAGDVHLLWQDITSDVFGIA